MTSGDLAIDLGEKHPLALPQAIERPLPHLSIALGFRDRGGG